MVTTGGQSRIGAGGKARSVLVTPSGQEVASTTPSVFGRSSSKNSSSLEDFERQEAAKRSAEEAARRKAAEELAQKQRDLQTRKQAEVQKQIIKQEALRQQRAKDRQITANNLSISSLDSRPQEVSRPRGSISPGQPRTQEQIIRSRIRNKRERGEGISFRDRLEVAGIGLTSSLKSTGRFGKELATSPIKTSKAVGKGLGVAGKKVITGKGFPELGRILRDEPEFATGFLAGELIGAKGSSLAIKGATRTAEVGRTLASPKLIKAVESASGEKILVTGSGGRIGLIPSKPISKSGGATKRGAFGFSKSEQSALIGQEGTISTTARGLFTPFRKSRTIESFEKGISASGKEKDFGLFATPFDRKTKLAQTRVSRVGSRPKEPNFLDLVSEDISFRNPKPQIVLFPKQTIGKNFKPFGRFVSRGVPTSELEVSLPPGSRVRKTGRLGVTLIQGRRVPVLTAEVLESESSIKPRNKLSRPKSLESPSRGLTRASLDLERKAISKSRLTSSGLQTSKRLSRGSVKRSSRAKQSIRQDIRSIDLESAITPRARTPARQTRRALRQNTLQRLAPRLSRSDIGLPKLTPRPRGKMDLDIKKSKKTTRRDRRKSRAPLIFTPDFTSKTLGIKKRFTRAELEQKATEGLALREVPIAID